MPRKQLIVGVIVLIFLGAVAAVGLSWAISTPTGCSTLPTAGEGTTVPVVLVVELEGNTADDAKNVEAFVGSQLEAIGKDLASAFAVRIAFVKNGEKSGPGGCLSEPRFLIPPKEDFATFLDDSTSDDTKNHLAKSMTEYRRDRIGWISEEAGDQVRQVSFEGLDPSKPRLSPRFVWNVAESLDDEDATVVVLSPFTSTVDDCFAPSDSISAKQQVNDCLQFDQVGALRAKATSLVIEPSLLDPLSRERAEGIRDALCEHATTDGCSVTATGL